MQPALSDNLKPFAICKTLLALNLFACIFMVRVYVQLRASALLRTKFNLHQWSNSKRFSPLQL